MTSDEKPPIILYFDEANALHQQRMKEDDASFYDALCTALDALNGDRAATFGIFLSTKLSLGAFAPPGEHHPSHRVHNQNHLLAPFTELPFDIHPKLPMDNMILDELHDVFFMCRFGRPL